ncbi:MAG: glycosyltransferase family 2 protein [Deltaproteobacteria bacterium]|nr:glycosyltransferase family 2 protein [Deltaproteobacteria bacterium]
MNETLVIGVAMRNGAACVGRALTSIFRQEPIRRPVEVLLVDDGSTDTWRPAVRPFRDRRELRIISTLQGSAWATRNAMIREVRARHDGAAYLARLDCDDELAGPDVLRGVDEVLRRFTPDVLFLGNRLRENGQLLARLNRATPKLAEPRHLEERLAGMAEGDPPSELPSCNTIIRTGVPFAYPPAASAEDHWLTADLLLRRAELRLHFDERLLWATYSLSGTVTARNRKGTTYRDSRLALLREFRRRTA